MFLRVLDKSVLHVAQGNFPAVICVAAGRHIEDDNAADVAEIKISVEPIGFFGGTGLRQSHNRQQKNHAEKFFKEHKLTSKKLFCVADALREENIFIVGELGNFFELVTID